jgi:hypothetical protein
MAVLQGNQGQTGKQTGQNLTAGFGESSDLLVTELQSRFYELNYRSQLFSIGCQLTALSAATILLTASAQPIVGVWNPPTSPVNLAILQAMLVDEINNVTSVAMGAFVWASSVGNSALTAGLAPFNRKNLTSAGSQAKAFSLSTASLLTGLTNNLVVFDAAEFNTASGLLTTTVAASTPTPSVSGVQNIDGSIIVPPGGVLALLNTVSSVTHSVAGRLLWAEVAI